MMSAEIYLSMGKFLHSPMYDIKNHNLYKLKKWVWLYIILLIFEGALRKWIFPFISTPLLFIREPIVLWLLLKSYHVGILRINKYWVASVVIGFLTFFAAVLGGHNSILVAIYGARVWILHIPLIFVIGALLNREDVLKLGRVLIYLSIPMTLLCIIQFYSPQSAWVNRGVGGDESGAGFGGALGFFRPPGTFSFTNGLSLFYGLCSSFLFYFIYNRNQIKKGLLYLALAAAILAIPFSISRTVLFQSALSLFLSLLIVLRNPKKGAYLVYISLIVFSLFSFVLSNKMIQTGLEVFVARFESASESEGGLKGTFIDRIFGKMIDAISSADDHSIWGKGIGADSNVGFALLGGQDDSRMVDFEWERTILELGPLLGLSILFLRISVSLKLLKISIRQILKKDDYLPWMILSFGFLQILQGQVAQSTSLGFIVLSSGLVIATSNQRFINNSLFYEKK